MIYIVICLSDLSIVLTKQSQQQGWLWGWRPLFGVSAPLGGGSQSGGNPRHPRPQKVAARDLPKSRICHEQENVLSYDVT